MFWSPNYKRWITDEEFDQTVEQIRGSFFEPGFQAEMERHGLIAVPVTQFFSDRRDADEKYWPQTEAEAQLSVASDVWDAVAVVPVPVANTEKNLLARVWKQRKRKLCQFQTTKKNQI